MTKNAIDFPCQFPIKIMGLAEQEFEGVVISILNQHVPDLGEGSIMIKQSAGGKYVSMTATIRARSQEQLDNLYRALSSHPKILMVL
jgi:putative lipoic acid-binding regulatory protein